MKRKIFTIKDDEKLISMEEIAYDAEALLQKLLARYPDLLGGDQMNPDKPRQWLLIGREVGLASGEDGGNRWSVDHLFIDQDSMPTIVEVKRSQDTRIRREVVGQMLEYAANAVQYWPIEQLQIQFEKQCKDTSIDPNIRLAELIGSNDISEFWQNVNNNLRTGKIRMIFVSDNIPSELRRIVEFMNLQMNPAEVLAVEIKQFQGEGQLRTMVPKIIGQIIKPLLTREQRDWDRDSFIKEIVSQYEDDRYEGAINTILDWAKKKNLKVLWGKGKGSGSFYPMWEYNGTLYNLVSFWSNSTVEIQFQYMYKRVPDIDEEWIKEIKRKFEIVFEKGLPPDGELKNRRPSVPMSALLKKNKLDEFLAILDEILNYYTKKVGG